MIVNRITLNITSAKSSTIRQNLALGLIQLRNLCSSDRMDIRPAPIGVEIRGVDLAGDLTNDMIDRFRSDVHKYRLLIFKNQNSISGQRHVEISKWFGDLESTFYKHPKSPHPDVFRVSNNREEGCTNVGRTGWHIDGSFMEKPFNFSLYHIVAVPETGDTGLLILGQFTSENCLQVNCPPGNCPL